MKKNESNLTTYCISHKYNKKLDKLNLKLIGSGAFASQKASNGGLDVSCNLYSIVFGADSNSGNLTQARTNNAAKDQRIAAVHYTNAEEPIGVVRVYSDSSTNQLYWGGGSSLFNAATQMGFFPAANNTTTNGSERLRISSTGEVNVPAGITLAQTIGSTAASNTLDDYEEGTWTATAEFSTGGFKSCANNVCRYVKIGGLVHISGRFSLNNHTGSSGELRIEGLPFSKGNPSGDGNIAGIQIYVEGAASNITNDIVGLVLDATTQFLIRRSGTTASGNDMSGLTDTGTTLLVGGTYNTVG